MLGQLLGWSGFHLVGGLLVGWFVLRLIHLKMLACWLVGWLVG